MCQDNCNTKRSKGEHLTYKDRVKIEHLYNQQDKNFAEIGRELNCHRTTVSREVKKGTVELRDYEWEKIEVYSPEKGQEVYEQNATAKGPDLKIGNNSELAKFIEKRIKKHKSPAAVAQNIRESDKFDIELHWKTIYNYIDKEILNLDREDLPHGNYKTGKERPKESATTTRRKEGRTIRDRPKEADTREEFGHWEMDLVEGLKGKGEPFLLVLTERQTRQEIIEIIPNKKSESVVKGLDRIERRFGVVNFRETFKTITTDNGSEFADYEGIEESFTGSSIPRTSQYYCDAYCSWQRGSNEVANRFIRRFLPKGTSFKEIKRALVKKIQKFINTYPRKMFGYKNSDELFREKLGFSI
jgi:IS30 family transposase